MSRGLPRDRESPEAFFERIFRNTYRNTLAYALRRTRDESDAHDVVGETYLVAWRRIDELRNVREPQAWLYGVAYKTLGNQRRGSQRREKLRDRATRDPTGRWSQDPSHVVAAGDELARVTEAMATLPSRDQEILRLAAFEGLSHREIGIALGIKQPLVRSLLYRARRRLNEALETTGMRPVVDSGHNSDVTARAEFDSRKGGDDD